MVVRYPYKLKGDEVIELEEVPDGPYLAEPMHFECCLCHARSTNETGEEATATMLIAMLADGVTADDWHQGLCFVHRRYIDNLVVTYPGQVA